MNKRDWSAALLQMAGMGTGVVAGWMVHTVVGLGALAASLIVSGLAIERRT